MASLLSWPQSCHLLAVQGWVAHPSASTQAGSLPGRDCRQVLWGTPRCVSTLRAGVTCHRPVFCASLCSGLCVGAEDHWQGALPNSTGQVRKEETSGNKEMCKTGLPGPRERQPSPHCSQPVPSHQGGAQPAPGTGEWLAVLAGGLPGQPRAFLAHTDSMLPAAVDAILHTARPPVM